ncbi:predicted protein [Trichoplax adhaerens]|uniref:Uncharacterized protein n=1 Tax=Trichoplax adhaerens TaxID=10228 RepID=B3SET4_TRIAD|nr:predicted protein [Trichoplax adhaerens]EDV18760.1 predicted protein [Trichoplax adhaerens]|eukprot:XP_002118757.1 predicted protein [Trichoplax adhaerens]
MNYALERKQVMYDKYGSLSYLGKTLYVVESTNEPSNSSVNKNYITVITPSPLEDPSEQYQGYEFFMFRLINDKKSFNAELRFTFTFDEQGSESYEKSDVVGTFKYLNANGSIIKAYISEGDTSTAKPNPVAEDILEQEKNT